ncbi:MAG TPA: pitrilysin family protein [Anaeromyxobacter sp.]|nr:pitrilysin family protein [Anaeromyxobacter sp.]
MSRRVLAVLAAAALGACAGPRSATPPAPAAPAPAAQAPAPAPPASAAPAAAGPDRSTVPENGPAPELRLPEQKHFALSNGLRVRLVEYRRLPIVALNMVLDAGGARDPARLPGLASFTAAMLTEGTRTRSATRISDEVGFLGASLSAGASPDAASLGGATLAKHLPAFLEVFADVAMSPAFPKADFARVQDQRLVTLLQQRDQPQALASRAFAPVFWGGKSPYGHYLLGTEEAVKATVPKDLAAFHERYWRPGNAELVVVGDVTEADLRPLLERTLGKWKPGVKVTPLAPAPAAAPKRTVLLEKADAPQAYLLIGMPGLLRSSDEFVAASVAFQVLGGGMSSRLFRNLREDKGYTYGVYARGDSRRLAGVSFVVGSVKADVTGPALKELLKEIALLRDEPVSQAELDDAKNALVLGLPADFAAAGAIAGRLGELAIYGLPDDYWNRYAENVRKVTAEDVRRFAVERLDPARLTLVMVANPAVVKPQLAELPLGPIEERPAPVAGGPAPAKGAR